MIWKFWPSLMPCCDAGVQVDDIAIGIGALFLFFFGADDLGHFGRRWMADITGAIRGLVCPATRWRCGGWASLAALGRAFGRWL